MPGWAPTMRARWPAITGAAKLLPVAVIVPPPVHGTSTSMPGAPQSAGPFGLHEKCSRSPPGVHATENTPANSLGIVRLRSLFIADTTMTRR